MPAQASTEPEHLRRPIVGSGGVVGLVLIALGFAGALLIRGQGGPWAARSAGVMFTLVESGWPPLLYLLSALGLGRLVRPLVRENDHLWALELGIGLTLMLSLTHGLGVLGLLDTISAWGITIIGLVMLAMDTTRLRSLDVSAIRLEPISAVIACAMMLALVMSCVPPGMLWGSEYGGFDALSYHLQLPREWIEQGKIWPSEHSVYSFLPGYIEASYAHMALLGSGGMLDRHASAAMSAQLLSAMMLIAASLTIAELTKSTLERVLPGADSGLAARFAMLLTLCTPWLLVVGSMAYNEIGVVLLGASALLGAMQTGVSPTTRGLLCGLIVGGACGCKPTAIFLLAPSVGIVLLACSPLRRWLLATLACVIAGALCVVPWLIRNEMAAGNPVFPQLSGIFGVGHWSQGQHAIYEQAHHFSGTLADRITLFLLPDTSGFDHVSRFRGITNAQWGLTPLLALGGLISLLVTTKTRRAGGVTLLALVVPIASWMLLTHIQSRFLIPLAPIMCVLGSLAVTRPQSLILRQSLSRVLAVLLGLYVVGFAMLQNRGNPFSIIDLGPGVSLGEYEFESLPWVPVLNQITDEDDTIYLLGDATPFYITRDVRYNTVYDRWLIEEAIEEHPAEPSLWTQTLEDLGIDVVVVGFTEIDRYARSGWLPPSIKPQQLIEWIDSLGEPIQVWNNTDGAPVRAVFRITPPKPSP